VFHFEMPGEETVLNGDNVTSQIGSEYAGKAASRVGTFPEVRAKLKAEQRRIAVGQHIICEGRDQGTAVFPDAPVKFFFTASVEVRAQRRIEQLRDLKLEFDAEDIRRQIAARDKQDEERAIDPLRKAADAIVIDTSNLSPEEVLQRMLTAVAQCHSPA
jgi:cytidylate kinase